MIAQNTKSFLKSINNHKDLEVILNQHKEYLKKILVNCCLKEKVMINFNLKIKKKKTHKNERIMETFNVIFEICNKFNKLLVQLEMLNIHSDSILAELLNLNSESQNLSNVFHKTNKLLFSLIGNEGSSFLQDLMNKLNFNNYYLSEAEKYLH